MKLNETCFLLMSSVFCLVSLTFHKTSKNVLSHFLKRFCLILNMSFTLRKGRRKSLNQYNLSSSFPLINGQTELFPQPSNHHLLCESHCWLQTRLVKLYLISESITCSIFSWIRWGYDRSTSCHSTATTSQKCKE